MRIFVLLTDIFGGYGGVTHFRTNLKINSSKNFLVESLSKANFIG
jgi:hypothetical protein